MATSVTSKRGRDGMVAAWAFPNGSASSAQVGQGQGTKV